MRAFLFSFAAVLFSMTLLFGDAFSQSPDRTFNSESTADAGPHETIFPGLTGNQLLDSLWVHYRPELVLSYDDARDLMFTFTDNNDNQIICVFTGDVLHVPAEAENPRADYTNPLWSTEHLWPQSKGAGAGVARRDLHHLRSIRQDVNASRSNRPFAFLEPNQVSTWWKGSIIQNQTPDGDLSEWSRTGSDWFFEVRDAEKGDVARAMFYFYTIYRTEADAIDPEYFYIQKKELRSYHNIDLVDAAETGRNERIETIQGNLNPFVVDTTLVRRAFFENFDREAGWMPNGYFVDFETGTKSSYSTASLSLNDREWLFENTLIAGANGDRFVGSRAARMRVPASIEMTQDKDRGLGKLSFLYSLSDFSGDGVPDAPIIVAELSMDEGISWEQIGSEINLAGVNELRSVSIEINEEESGRIRIRTVAGSEGRRLNIDDIYLSDFIIEEDDDEDDDEDPVSVNPDSEDLPRAITLEQNYPNPFNPVTQIRFELAESSDVRLDVFNIQGQRVATVLNETRSAGSHTVTFDASTLSSGVYIYRLYTGSQILTRKMALIK